MRYVLIGAACGAIALNGIGQFLARFFVGSLDLGLEEAGRTLGLLSLVSMASGFALGGFGMDWAARFDRAWYARGPAVALLVSMPLLIVGFLQRELSARLHCSSSIRRVSRSHRTWSTRACAPPPAF
jgi:hypothetical protein